jgi:hypothetical protein
MPCARGRRVVFCAASDACAAPVAAALALCFLFSFFSFFLLSSLILVLLMCVTCSQCMISIIMGFFTKIKSTKKKTVSSASTSVSSFTYEPRNNLTLWNMPRQMQPNQLDELQPSLNKGVSASITLRSTKGRCCQLLLLLGVTVATGLVIAAVVMVPRKTQNAKPRIGDCAFLRATKITHTLKQCLIIGIGDATYADPAKHVGWNAKDGGTDADPQGDEYGRPFPVDGAHIPRSQKRLCESNQLGIIVGFGQTTRRMKHKTNKQNECAQSKHVSLQPLTHVE